jgi:hypothetical protein
MHPHLPREYVEKWAYQNPKSAMVVLAFGAVFIGFAIWLLFTDP